jgi:hypothetical protein
MRAVIVIVRGAQRFDIGAACLIGRVQRAAAPFEARFPAWEVAVQLGHKSRDYRSTELYATFDPAYLGNALKATNLIFSRLRVRRRTVLQNGSV